MLLTVLPALAFFYVAIWAHSLKSSFSVSVSQRNDIHSLSCEDSSLRVVLLADTNRDGRVRTQGDSDRVGKETWTRDRGALFLAAISDTDGRCSRRITAATPDAELQSCHDAADNVLRTPALLAPLRTVPRHDLVETAVGSLRVNDGGRSVNATRRVRLFHQSRLGWTLITPATTFSAAELRAGLRLGIDGRDVRRPGIWDGRVLVELVVRDRDDRSRCAADGVALRVAPVLTHHHGQRARRVVVASDQDTAASNSTMSTSKRRWQRKFIANLRRITRAVDPSLDLMLLNPSVPAEVDKWTQDFFEPAYMTIPGRDGPVGLRIMVRSAQRRAAGRLVFSQLRSATTGAVQLLGAAGDTTDSLGNLETLPPHKQGGLSSRNGSLFPAGRSIMGAQEGVEPLLLPFLHAQEEQAPLVVDTSWLHVGHVDEFLQFLGPAKMATWRLRTATPDWFLVVSDPREGLGLLRRAQQLGLGRRRVFSRPPGLGAASCISRRRINEVLARPNFTDAQEFGARNIDKAVALIQRETGLPSSQIVRVPAVYTWNWDRIGVGDCLYPSSETSNRPAFGRINSANRATAKSVPNIRDAGSPQSLSLSSSSGLTASGPQPASGSSSSSSDQVLSFFPSVVNGLVVAERRVIAPNPWGPRIGGVDLVASAVEAAYARINYSVTFIDDWLTHHKGFGDVHCGTNTLREFDKEPWWPWE